MIGPRHAEIRSISPAGRWTPNGASTGVWAITSYFNPAGYKRRLENYRTFRRHLTAPLVTVELSHDGRFELDHGDADVLVQVREPDVMWQKERLLNVALDHLPQACVGVAWLDCDVVFQNERWPTLTRRALDEYEVVHLFHERYDLSREATVDEAFWGGWGWASHSIVFGVAAGILDPRDTFPPHAGKTRAWTVGLAWAARRELLQRHRFYDTCIVGGGDTAVLSAALGRFDNAIERLCLSPCRRAHYLAWARPFFDDVRGRVGYLPGRVVHLWHGALEHRQYGERHRHLQTFDFDPARDVAVGPNGCLQWKTRKDAMHEYLRAYFDLRREDGA